MKRLLSAALALSATLSMPAAAATIVGATTLTDPVYNRPLSGIPPSGLSAVGTAVHYNVIPFTVSANGSYVFQMTAVGAWDNFLGLHANAFNPASALTNALAYNDDNPSIGLSGFTIALSTGISYFAIATGFGNNTVGEYSLAINGPGAVNVGGAPGAVPEPSTWAMIIAGFGIVGGALRRRRRTTHVFA
jgi:PEP-CTERM motif